MTGDLNLTNILLVTVASLLVLFPPILFYIRLKRIADTNEIIFRLNRHLEIRQILDSVKELLSQRYRHLRVELLYLDRHKGVLKWLGDNGWVHFHITQDSLFLQSSLRNRVMKTSKGALKGSLDREIADTLSLEEFVLIPFSMSVLSYYSKGFGRLSYICDGGRESCLHNKGKNIYERYLQCRQCEAFSALGLVVLQSRSRPLGLREIKEIQRIITMPAVAQCLYNASLYEWTRYLSTKDELTGLYNYRGLIENLNMEIARARRFNHSLSLLFIDIDDFKAVNREKGHLYGNIFLKRLAQRLSAHTRASDYACRFGGDEFVLLLPDTGKVTALTIAFRIRSDLDNHVNQEGCSLSIGIATYPEDGSSTEELIDAAERAMRRAKEEGKNRIIL